MEPSVHVVGKTDTTQTIVVVVPAQQQTSLIPAAPDDRVPVVYRTYASDVYDDDWTVGWAWWVFFFVCILFFLPLIALSSAWYTT